MHKESVNKPDSSGALQTNETDRQLQMVASDAQTRKHSLITDLERTEEERLKAYAHLLDNAIRLPGGFRVGLDGVVGLVPGIGDLLGAVLSGYLIYGASRLDIPRYVIAQMLVNTALETAIGVIPLVGDAFDFFFKANERNARLLHAALEVRDAERQSREHER